LRFIADPLWYFFLENLLVAQVDKNILCDISVLRDDECCGAPNCSLGLRFAEYQDLLTPWSSLFWNIVKKFPTLSEVLLPCSQESAIGLSPKPRTPIP